MRSNSNEVWSGHHGAAKVSNCCSRTSGCRQDFDTDDNVSVVSSTIMNNHNQIRHQNRKTTDVDDTERNRITNEKKKWIPTKTFSRARDNSSSHLWKSALVNVTKQHRRLSDDSHSHPQEDPVHVPVPLPFLVNVIQGSAVVTVVPKESCKYTINGQALSVRSCLDRGDCLRIFAPHTSADWVVSLDQATAFDDFSFTLMRPYDHTHVLRSEASEKSNEEICRRLMRRSNNDLPIAYESDNPSDTGKIEVREKRISDIPDGSNFVGVRLWKLVSKKDDKRQAWRREYDDGAIGWTCDYDKSRVSKQFCFGVKLKLRELEDMCVDVPCDPDNSLHMQRVNFVSKVETNKLLGEAFRFVCQWHPVGKLIDQVKWAKFARKMRFLPGVNNSKHEVDMAFFRQSSQRAGRKLDEEGFKATILDIAKLQYTNVDEENALSLVLWDTVIMLPSVKRLVWFEAKQLAMKQEANRVCAQIRLAACYRRKVAYQTYCKTVQTASKFARIIRWRIATKRIHALAQSLRNDRRFRLRFTAVIKIQKNWRCYHWKSFFVSHLKAKSDNERQEREKHRYLLKQKKLIRETELVYRRVLRIRCVTLVVSMMLKGLSCYEKNIVVDTYVPCTKEVFHFVLNETILRDCMESSLQSDGPLSWNEMLHKDALFLLTKRLMVRFVNRRPIIIFRRRSITEPGELVAKRCTRIGGVVFVLFIYRSPNDFVICAYDRNTSTQFRLVMTLTELQKQLREDSHLQQRKNHHDSIHGNIDSKGVELLTIPKQYKIISWIESKLQVINDPLTRISALVLSKPERKEETRKRASVVIQCAWRQFLSRKVVRSKIKLAFDKVFDRDYCKYYYVHKSKNKCQWGKPRLLEPDDLDDPVDRWEVVFDENGAKYYFNAATGQMSWMTESEAAQIIQRIYRRRDGADIIGGEICLYRAAKALSFIRLTQENFKKDSTELSHICNYALLCHCLQYDFNAAKYLYEEAIRRSPKHPIISRAYGIFILQSCQMPRDESFQKACRLFDEATLNDANLNMFQPTIENFFQWSVIANPRNSLVLLNFALLHQCVFEEYDKADKLYRRAIAIEPSNSLIAMNYKLFDAQRYPGGRYEGKGPSVSAVLRSHISEKRSEWGEWQLMVDEASPRREFQHFWYNSLKKVTLFDEPDWNLVWRERINRSNVISDNSDSEDFVKYFDSQLNMNFMLIKSTGKCVPSI